MTKRARKSKNEFPPLLAGGLHEIPIQDLKSLVVDRFPNSNRREGLWANFLIIISRLEQVGIPCDIWVDGSFLTEKIDPDDVDFVVDVRIDRLINPTPEQSQLFDDLSGSVYKSSHDLHSFVMFNAPAIHTEYASSVKLHDQWKADFGISFVGRVAKGIAVIKVTP
jgi:hypothetical protein